MLGRLDSQHPAKETNVAHVETDESEPLLIRVVGDPAPKGSSRAMLIGGKARLIASAQGLNAKKQASWKTAVADAVGARPSSFTSGAVAIGIVFRLPLRKGDLDKFGAPKPAANDAVIVKPDVDKLVRSTLDALTFAGAWGDDSQVAILLAAKVYMNPGASLGATIVINGFDPLSIACRKVSGVVQAWMFELEIASRSMQEARSLAQDVRTESAKAARLDRITKNGKKPLLPKVPPFPPSRDDDWGVS